LNGKAVGSPIDPGLSGLANNGGPAVGADGAFNLKTVGLLPTSPAIGAADPTTVAGTIDENGTTRSTTTPNIGAVEFVASPAPAPAPAFTITGPATASSGTPFDFVVTAVDSFGSLATSYAGTITFSFDDGSTSLPDFTFDPTTSAGTASFTLNVETPETLTVTVTDGTLTATYTVIVS
jgi:hypothetical protein